MHHRVSGVAAVIELPRSYGSQIQPKLTGLDYFATNVGSDRYLVWWKHSTDADPFETAEAFKRLFDEPVEGSSAPRGTATPSHELAC